MAKRKNKTVKLNPNLKSNEETKKEYTDKTQVALEALMEKFKNSPVEERTNILFNMIMNLGTSLDKTIFQLDMVAGTLHRVPGVDKVIEDMKNEYEEQQKEKETTDE